ncbi:MAG: hypothetical protein IJ536_02015 [Acidaminococcaceae bacterium]|nr:hypothetical protein [Acidaminococcaceae bacterium]
MTQQENLNEFMNRRMAELGLGYKALTNAGIGGQTIQNIKNGIPFRMAEVTKSKLANALQCTIGDINAALSQTAQTTPFGEEVRKVPVKKEGVTMKAVEMLADALQEQGLLSEENQQKTEEKVTVPEQTETLSEETVTNPEQKEIKVSNFEWQQEKPPAEQPKPKRKKIVSKGLKETEPEEPETLTVETYRQQLKDMCLAKFTKRVDVDVARISIANELLRDLLGKEAVE